MLMWWFLSCLLWFSRLWLWILCDELMCFFVFVVLRGMRLVFGG